MSKELNNFTHCSKLDLIKMYKKSRRDMRRLSRQKVDLEQKNAELKEELKNWKEEWQEQVQKATDESWERTLQTIQLTKAKELLAKWVELYKPKSDTALPTPIQVDTEQFLNGEKVIPCSYISCRNCDREDCKQKTK